MQKLICFLCLKNLNYEFSFISFLVVNVYIWADKFLTPLSPLDSLQNYKNELFKLLVVCTLYFSRMIIIQGYVY